MTSVRKPTRYENPANPPSQSAGKLGAECKAAGELNPSAAGAGLNKQPDAIRKAEAAISFAAIYYISQSDDAPILKMAYH